jgi:hypothetical protein
VRVTGPAQPAELLLDVADRLADLQIPFALAGALAVSFYGIPRSTADADVVMWVRGSGKTPRDILDVLRAAGYSCEQRTGDPTDPIRDCIRILDGHGNRMDILLGVRGMEQSSVDRCVDGRLLEVPIRILGPEDLIAMKLSAGGTKDIGDVRGVLEVSREILNVDLLRRITKRFGRETLSKLETLLRESAL